jgi:hypothetical protein
MPLKYHYNGILMPNEEKSRGSPGRPENEVPSREVRITNMDPVTFRMLEGLVMYGRFGRTKQEVVLFIVRSWLLEREASLRTAIASREAPLGVVYPEPE